ncbi:hypothetical protein ASG22_15625 [Chryseobacterium sp. Leaf405]|nr:hypothetical protein ASG22_15625 [Chryseobacterium sp. Leaf405]
MSSKIFDFSMYKIYIKFSNVLNKFSIILKLLHKKTQFQSAFLILSKNKNVEFISQKLNNLKY